MKKALGGLFTRPYQSPEAHGTAGAPGVFSLARFQFLLLPSQDGVRPRPLLPAPPPVPPPKCRRCNRHWQWKLCSRFKSNAGLGHVGAGDQKFLRQGVSFGSHDFCLLPPQ